MLTPLVAAAQNYSGPLVITKGGTYTGNWESRDTNIPAVEITTSEPVVIINSNIRSAGRLIRFTGAVANITVRHTNGYGLTPTPWKGYKKSRNFLVADEFKNIVVENCYFEGIAGINLGGRYQGNGTPSETIKIRYNKIKNIDGRIHGGWEKVNFVGLHFRNGISHAEIAWNQIINEANNSVVEDNINIHNARGTANSPIKIHNNYIQGSYPLPATSSTYTGGGILADGDGTPDTSPAFLDVYENQLVGLGAYSLGIAGGHNIRYHHNRAINATTFANGAPFNMYTGGLWSKDYYHKGSMYENSVDNNTVAIYARNYPNLRNNVTVAEGATFRDNIFPLNTVITLEDEQNEFKSWNQKLQKNGIVLGPNGSSQPAPANAAPTVAITSPSNNSSYTEGSISVSVAADDSDGSVKKVELFQGSTKVSEKTSGPFNFTLSNLTAGSYTLTAKATDDDGASTTSKAIQLNVTKAEGKTPSPQAPQAPQTETQGAITREFWSNLPYGSVNVIPVSKTPNSTTTLSSFEAPSNAGDNYGQRISGYITAPQSGQYTFWIAGDDDAELYLSTSEDPNSKKRIAYVDGYTNSREWEKYKSQKSASVSLEAGKRYYIEALHKENSGGDNLAVAWQMPNGAKEMPISGNSLSPKGSTKPTVATTGKIEREFWGNVSIKSADDIPVNKTPDSVTELTLFEAPSNAGNDYGQRIRGYITAPQSGEYTFWIAGDDEAELWLSTSDNPNNKSRIAYINGPNNWTNSREWNKYSSQKSAKVNLKAGQLYYIEALHVEHGGGDNLAVGWQLPDGDMERPIAGNRLTAFGSSLTSTSSSAMTASSFETEPLFNQVSAYPNPFNEVITLNMGEQETELKEVVILDQTGKVIYKQQNLTLEGNKLTINLAGAGLKRGLYFLRYADKAGATKTLKVVKQ
ncbi:PA14 domain-containing protein [Pontibacter rugosus]|uniref:PA14 domain-containing protein n=1 Tax=Pontibacter rugosus TaxID=1745966 RepID=A0ABW3SVJ1_9BACT